MAGTSDPIVIQRPHSAAAALQRADEFFMNQGPLFQAAERLIKTLDELEIPFAIMGAMAVNAHGHERMTADLDILLTPDGLHRFKAAKLGLGWVEKFSGSKGMRDAVTNVPIVVLLTGDYPGDGLAKPISFPSPDTIVVRDDRNWPIPRLNALIELKCASGMTAMERPRDFDDVIQLIRINQIKREFAEDLNPYVRATFAKLWEAAQIRRPE